MRSGQRQPVEKSKIDLVPDVDVGEFAVAVGEGVFRLSPRLAVAVVVGDQPMKVVILTVLVWFFRAASEFPAAPASAEHAVLADSAP